MSKQYKLEKLMISEKLKKVVRIVLYGPAVSQSDCRRAGPYQLPCNNVLYRVVYCRMKFDRDQTFSLNKCCTVQCFFCFRGCCMMFFFSFGHPVQPCCTLLYARVSDKCPSK